MRRLGQLGAGMLLLGAITFVWRVKLLSGVGSVPSLVLLAAGALLLGASLFARHRRSSDSTTGMGHPTL